LPAGAHSITARATDAAGNTSLASGALAVSVSEGGQTSASALGNAFVTLVYKALDLGVPTAADLQTFTSQLDPTLSQQSRTRVAAAIYRLPQHRLVEVNALVKAIFRGLKNQPGSAEKTSLAQALTSGLRESDLVLRLLSGKRGLQAAENGTALVRRLVQALTD